MAESNDDWMTEELKNEYYRETGKLLGYPICCIDFYLECPNPMEVPEPQRVIWEQNGKFLPCKKDAEKIHSKICTVDNLIDHEERKRNKLPPLKIKVTAENLARRVNQILKEKDPKKWENLKV